MKSIPRIQSVQRRLQTRSIPMSPRISEKQVKFELLSDVHLEFGPLAAPEAGSKKDTVALLAGDIQVGLRGTEYLKQMADAYAKVCYTAGNHEYYGEKVQS